MLDEKGNTVSLKEYVERIFEEREKALNLAFRAQQEALAVATVSLNRELEHLNKLRQEVLQDRANFITRSEFKMLDDRIGQISATQSGGQELLLQFRRMVVDVDNLKTNSVSRDAISSYNRWLAGISITVVLTIIGVITTFILRSH